MGASSLACIRGLTLLRLHRHMTLFGYIARRAELLSCSLSGRHFDTAYNWDETLLIRGLMTCQGERRARISPPGPVLLRSQQRQHRPDCLVRERHQQLEELHLGLVGKAHRPSIMANVGGVDHLDSVAAIAWREDHAARYAARGRVAEREQIERGKP